MYALIKTGGKQYKVEAGATITVERLSGDVGESVDFTPVMLVDGSDVTVGADIGDRTVSGTIDEHVKGEKLTVFTYKNKTRQRKKNGTANCSPA